MGNQHTEHQAPHRRCCLESKPLFHPPNAFFCAASRVNVSVVSGSTKPQRLFARTHWTINRPVCSRRSTLPRTTETFNDCDPCLRCSREQLRDSLVISLHLIWRRINLACAFAGSLWSEARARIGKLFCPCMGQRLVSYASVACFVVEHRSIVFAKLSCHYCSFLAIAAFAQKTLVSNSVNATDRSRDGGHSWVIRYANSFALSRMRPYRSGCPGLGA